jgi:hypothetical protein
MWVSILAVGEGADMRRRWLKFSTATAALVVLALTQGSAVAAVPTEGRSSAKPYTFAVIGDIPYGDAQIQHFPQVVDQINADPDVALVDHLGDIKSGSSLCTDEYFSVIKSQFDRFRDPLVYTVGDNEWTDCHRANNGSYNPLERLAKIRQIFFPHPGFTLGAAPVPVWSDAGAGYPENERYRRARVAFAAIHVVGSNNSLAPWTGAGNTTATPEQTAEVLGRTASVIYTIRSTFADARRHHDRAVVLLTQADMFDPTVTSPSFPDYYAFQPIVHTLIEEAERFHGPVYLFNGDSHVFNKDQPLASGSPWLAFYNQTTPANNLIRITIDGSTAVNNYLKVTIQPHGPNVLTWTKVPFMNS